MGLARSKKVSLRLRRKQRVRKKVWGTSQRPRLNVFRSLQHIHVQAIDDEKGFCLAAASTLDGQVRQKASTLPKTQAAHLVGQLVAKRLMDQKIACVVFDRGGFCYTGRVAALAQGAREAGIHF
ncbi:MAG: 50S ribosomal protein L18 [Myxococcota bacterium]